MQINRALDSTVQATLRRESAQVARAQLTELFGDLWESLSEQAQRQLVQAEVYRRDAELLADTEEGFEFSAAVGAYSRAVEVELLRRLFEPFRSRADAAELPKPRSDVRCMATISPPTTAKRRATICSKSPFVCCYF